MTAAHVARARDISTSDNASSPLNESWSRAEYAYRTFRVGSVHSREVGGRADEYVCDVAYDVAMAEAHLELFSKI